MLLQVGRRADPLADAAAAVAIRAAVGPGIALRADANRQWSLASAAAFAQAAAAASLEVSTLSYLAWHQMNSVLRLQSWNACQC